MKHPSLVAPRLVSALVVLSASGCSDSSAAVAAGTGGTPAGNSRAGASGWLTFDSAAAGASSTAAGAAALAAAGSSAGPMASAGMAGILGTGYLLLDDGEDGDEINQLGGRWITYDDNDVDGESIVSPAPWHRGVPFAMSEPGYGDSDYAVQITGTTGSVLGYDYFGLVAGLGPESFCPDPEPPATSLARYRGLRFRAKGSREGGTFTLIIAHRKNGSADNCSNGIIGDTLTQWADYQMDITSLVTDDWSLIAVDFRHDLHRPSWGAAVDIETVLAGAKDIVWQYQNANGGTAELWLDDVELTP